MIRIVRLACVLGIVGGIAVLVPHNTFPSMQAQQPPAQAKARAEPQRVEPPLVPMGEGVPLSFLVLDAANGDPIPSVSIELRSPARPVDGRPTYWSYQLQTDGSGKAALADTAAGPYQMVVKKDKRVLVSGSVLSLNLQPKDKPAPIVFRMFLASRVSGSVENREHMPIPNVRVELLREAWQAGMRVLEIAQNFAVTDAGGNYAFDGVLPGTYYLRARPTPALIQAQLGESDRSEDPQQRHTAYVNTLYPATPFLESATPLHVFDGVDQQGTRIEMQRDRYYPIRGHLENVLPEQKQLGLLLFRSVSFDSRFQFIWNQAYDGAISVEVKPDFSFAYEIGLPPGPYWAGFVPADKVRGGADFRVADRALEDLRIEVTPALRFYGKMVDEDGQPVPGTLAHLATFASRRALYQRDFGIRPDGNFETSGLTPAAYRLDLPGAPLVIRKIERDGRTYQGGNFDLTPTGEETIITVSRKGAVIGGTVEMLRIAQDYPRGMVTALPDPSRPTDMVKRTRLDGTNTFKFEHLEPGGYRLCAWLEEGTEVNQVMGNPAYEQKISPRCEHVDVKADETKSAALSSAPLPSRDLENPLGQCVTRMAIHVGQPHGLRRAPEPAWARARQRTKRPHEPAAGRGPAPQGSDSTVKISPRKTYCSTVVAGACAGSASRCGAVRGVCAEGAELTAPALPLRTITRPRFTDTSMEAPPLPPRILPPRLSKSPRSGSP